MICTFFHTEIMLASKPKVVFYQRHTHIIAISARGDGDDVGCVTLVQSKVVQKEHSAILSTFILSYHLSLRSLFCLFLVAVLHRFYCIILSITPFIVSGALLFKYSYSLGYKI